MAVDEAHRAGLAAGDHRPRLLHKRVAAIVKGYHMRDARSQSSVAKLPALGRVQRQRLVRDDMLPGLKCRHRDCKVKVIWCGVVNDRDIGIGDQIFIAPISAIDLIFVCLSLVDCCEEPATATTSTSPSRLTASMWCRATNPGPTRPMPMLFIRTRTCLARSPADRSHHLQAKASEMQLYEDDRLRNERLYRATSSVLEGSAPAQGPAAPRPNGISGEESSKVDDIQTVIQVVAIELKAAVDSFHPYRDRAPASCRDRQRWKILPRSKFNRLTTC